MLHLILNSNRAAESIWAPWTGNSCKQKLGKQRDRHICINLQMQTRSFTTILLYAQNSATVDLLILVQVVGVLEPISAVNGWEAGFFLVHHMATDKQPLTLTPVVSNSPLILTAVDYGTTWRDHANSTDKGSWASVVVPTVTRVIRQADA